MRNLINISFYMNKKRNKIQKNKKNQINLKANQKVGLYK